MIFLKVPPHHYIHLKIKPTVQNLVMNLSDSRSHTFPTCAMIVLQERVNLLCFSFPQSWHGRVSIAGLIYFKSMRKEAYSDPH